MSKKSLRAAIAALALAGGMIVPTVVAQATPQQDSYAYSNVATTQQSQVVNLIFEQTNAERTKRSLQPLKTDAHLQARAQQWSNYMASIRTSSSRLG